MITAKSKSYEEQVRELAEHIKGADIRLRECQRQPDIGTIMSMIKTL